MGNPTFFYYIWHSLIIRQCHPLEISWMSHSDRATVFGIYWACFPLQSFFFFLQLYISHSVPSLALVLFFFPSLSLSFFSLYLSLQTNLFSLFRSLSLSLTLYLYLETNLPMSVYLSLSCFLSVSLFVSISLPLSISLLFSHSLSIALSLLLSLLLFLSLLSILLSRQYSW